MKNLTGYSNINFWTVFTQVVVVLITIYGHKGIETFASLAAHFMVILAFVLFGYLFTEYNIGDLIHLPTSQNPKNTVITGFDIVVATAFSWLPLVCDYNRNATSSKTGIIGTYAGYNIGTFLAMALGATVSGLSILSNITQTYDPTDLIGSKHPWLGLLPALVIFVSVVSTNVMALYSSTLSYLAVFQKQKYLATTIVIGVITILGALLKQWLLDHFQNFLLMIGTLLIPVGALMIVDYYLVNRGYYDPDEIINGTKKLYWYFKGVNVYTYISYFLGAGFGYYFTYVRTLPTGATILTFLVTSVVYWGLIKMTGKSVVPKNIEKPRELSTGFQNTK
ncbi:purine-cytosine permease family protein [Collibacillus ludicampi]|uniref:purine-cytosine permease family protein n=1 Tax=Collibacillus ludicampi TaxID=2771369 RepID=UPI002494FF82|nr:cytosine permease [Collibacillus ludicampi]